MLLALQPREQLIGFGFAVREDTVTVAKWIRPAKRPGVVAAFGVDQGTKEGHGNVERAGFPFKTGLPGLRTVWGKRKGTAGSTPNEQGGQEDQSVQACVACRSHVGSLRVWDKERVSRD